MTSVPVTIQERIPMPVSPAARPGSVAVGFSLSDMIRVLKQAIFLILFVWFVVIGLTVGATFYLGKYHESYTAMSVVLVESPNPKTPLQFGERGVPVQLMDRFVADQMVLVKDNEVLSDAIQTPEVVATDWYKSQPDKNLILDELKDELSVGQIPKTNYFRVVFATRKPGDAPTIVNMVVEKYIGKVESLTRAAYTTELEDYERQQKILEDRLRGIQERKLQFLASEIGTAGITEGLNVVGEMWRTLAIEVTQLEVEKLQYKAAYENLVGVDPSMLAISPQMTLMIQQDPQVQTLANTLLSLDNGRQIMLMQVGKNHREVRDLDSQIDVLQEKYDQVVAKREKDVRDYEVNSARTIFLNAIQAELMLKERMQEAEYKQRDLDRHLAEYRTQEDRQALIEMQLADIRRYINQLKLVIKDRGMVRVHPVSKARKPLKRSFPRWELNLPIGVFLGLLLGVGLAVLLELADTSIKTTRDVVRHVHVPILGPVPDLDDEEVPIDRIEIAAHTAPRSMIAEAFRTVRTNLLLSSPAERQRSLLVTSAQPEEGTTSVACNLAISLGQSGRRVLLVDANFHRPALHRIFPQTRPEGLSNVLIGQAKLAELVNVTEFPNVDVLTTGPTPPNPAELLASRYFQELITQAADRYDQVIFDGPPVLLVSDTLVMTGAVDGVVLVCKAKKGASRGVMLRAREQLERVNGRIFGVVLNAAQSSRGGYFREQIRTYYDYQAEESTGTEVARALPGRDDPEPGNEVSKDA